MGGYLRSGLLLLLLTALAWAGGPSFVEADRAFNRGDLAEATRAYEACAADARARSSPEDLARALEGLAALHMIRGEDGAWREALGTAISLRRTLPSPASTGSNLAVEGGFERGLIPPWGTGHYEAGSFNFGTWWNSLACRSYAKMDGAVVHSGRASLRITNFTPVGPHLFGTTAQRIRAVSPNSLYEVSVWARGEGLAQNGAIQLVVDPGWHIRPLSLPAGTWDWRLLKAQFDSGDLSFIDLRILSLAPGTAWLDDLVLRKLGEGEQARDPLLRADDLFRRGFAREALQQYRDLERQDPARAPTCRARMAEALAALGEYGEAMALYAPLRTPTSYRVGMAMGDIYLNLGQPEKALEQFQDVRSRVSGDQAMRALACDRVAMALLRLDRVQEAAAYQGEALQILTHINDPHGRGMGLGHLARIYLRGGSVRAARECLEGALPLARTTGDRKLEADLLTWRAVARGREQDLRGAVADLAEAIRLRREVYDRYGLIDSLYWLGHFQALQGDRAAAVGSLTEAVDLLEGVKDGANRIERSAETLVRGNAAIYEELVRLLLQEGRAEQALEVLARSRSEELRRLFQGQAPALKAPQQEAFRAGQELAGDREALERRLQQELSRPPAEQDPSLVEEARRRREKSQADYRAFLRDLFQSHPELAGLISVHPKQLKLKQSSLPENGAIVEYLCGERQLYLFLVTRTALEVRVLDLPRAELASRIAEWRRRLLLGMDSPAEDPALLELSHQLYRDLLGPVEPLLRDVRTLAILPNGPLHYLPFQALVCDLPRREFLVDRMACVNLCEESFLGSSNPNAKPRRLLILGNPDGSLVHAEEEVRRVASLFPESKAYLGAQASKDLVTSMRGGYEGLHIASHSVLDSRDAANSYILLAPRGGDEATGRLTMREVWGLDLEGLELVTLSACSTGLGQENPGDDLISLENAFLFAGARAVVASLWDVDDEATGRLMGAFYEKLGGGDRAQALRQAQQAVKATWPHPFYWASFILVGPPVSGGP